MHRDIKDLKVLFELHYQNLCYFAFTMVGDKVLAEDFVQDAFLSLHKNVDDIKDDEKALKSYLYTSVRNSVLNWNRRNLVESKYHERTPFQELFDGDFDLAIIKAEVLSEINKIIFDLPPSCQQIFKMYYINGLSIKEIAEQLKVSSNTVKTQKLRGLKFVQSKLNPELFLYLILFEIF